MTAYNKNNGTKPSHPLTILFLNACSLLPKLDNLILLSSAHSPKVICISETWLSQDILDSEIHIPNYMPLRRDRNRHSGGVAIYILSSLSPSIVSTTTTTAEFLLCSLTTTIIQSYVGNFYCPPSFQTDLYSLSSILNFPSVHLFFPILS